TLSPIVLTRHVVRSMMSERAGRIINMSSIVATTGYQSLSVYSATKASLIGFTRALAREVGQLGITVNAVAPGFTDTEMTRELDPKQREQIIRRSALRRLPEPADVAATVKFLLSEEARNITGTTLTVDAGNTAYGDAAAQWHIRRGLSDLLPAMRVCWVRALSWMRTHVQQERS